LYRYDTGALPPPPPAPATQRMSTTGKHWSMGKQSEEGKEEEEDLVSRVDGKGLDSWHTKLRRKVFLWNVILRWGSAG
jgi:hypothetical protein